MKKFLKMMLVLGLLALAVSGCNIFGSDDDDDDDEKSKQDLSSLEIKSFGSCLLDGNLVSSAKNYDIDSISMTTYNGKSVGCYGEIVNTGDTKLSFYICVFLNTKIGGRVASYLKFERVELDPKKSSGELVYASEDATSSVASLAPDSYKLCIDIIDTDISKTFDFITTN